MDTPTLHPDHAQAYAQALTQELLGRYNPLELSDILRDLKNDIINTLRERRDKTEKEAKELEEAIKQISKL